MIATLIMSLLLTTVFSLSGETYDLFFISKLIPVTINQYSFPDTVTRLQTAQPQESLSFNYFFHVLQLVIKSIQFKDHLLKKNFKAFKSMLRAENTLSQIIAKQQKCK